MSRYIAFLRAINVGGRRVKMDELRAHFEAMPLANVETFIASGNVTFDAGGHDAQTLQDRIEAHLHETLGYPVTTFLRTNHEVAQIAQYQPFDAATMAQAQALNVAFLAAPLAEEQHEVLMGLRSEIDDFHTHNCEIYWLCRKPQSESDFSNVVLERALQLQATFRTINTLVRLAAKYPV